MLFRKMHRRIYMSDRCVSFYMLTIFRYSTNMKNILLIQSRATSEGAREEQERYRRAIGDAASLALTSTLDIEQSWDTPSKIVEGYDGIVLGGSSDFFIHGGKGEEEAERAGAREIMDRMRLLVEYLVERQVPTLGVCFGHQLIAEVFGGTVTHDHSQKKGGTHEVRLTETGKDDPLFAGFPAVFPAQYGHRDSVTRPPLGAVVLAEGDSCRFAALRYGSEVYTLQFHPELFPDDLLSHPEILALYLPEGADPAAAVRETSDAARLIARFVERIAGAVNPSA